MILLPIIPWILQGVQRRRFYRKSILDLPLWVFLLTALLGIWTAYNREQAWDKFWIILAAFFLFQALAKQPRANIRAVAILPGILGMLVGFYFLNTHDWTAQPSDLADLTRIGVRWMTLRPTITGPYLHPNIAGGVIATLLPFTVAAGRYFQKARHLGGFTLVALIGVVNLAALALTSSRAAWISISLGLGAWFFWSALRNWPGLSRNSRRIVVLAAGLAIFITLFGIYLSATQGIGSLLGSLPGPNNTGSRLDLYRNTLELIRDFFLTGGGLGSFSGLYSQYILRIPQPYFDYSHNLYLDLWLEQGLLGLLAFLGLILSSLAILFSGMIRQSAGQDLPALLRMATLAGFCVFIVHGFVDDAPYGMRGMPVMFLLPGIAFFLTQFNPEPGFTSKKVNSVRLGITLGLVGITLFASIFLKPVRSGWFANLGSVEMARVELADWPTGKWSEGQLAGQFAIAETYFNRSLELDLTNPTALYRLGLIAMERHAYPSAVQFLDQAFLANPGQRGVIKSLGFSYVWIGDYPSALSLLKMIPEARHELRTYVSWWPAHGRVDLGLKAEEMLSLFLRGG